MPEPISNKSIERVSIYSAGGDLSKGWFVHYYRDVGSGIMQRVRIYDNINKFATVERRMDRALEIVQLAFNGENAVTGYDGKKFSNDLFKVVKKVLLQKQYILRKKSFQTGVVKENLFDKIKRCPEERKGSLYFQPEQVSRLKLIISEKEPALWLACQFIYYCFIRPGELRNLKVSDVMQMIAKSS
ncbi:MAG: hypothetical protein IPO83_00045 [Chitinophagaceae bacterium]|nr:hypothetical protein [Chitinophagaceae bacterium]